MTLDAASFVFIVCAPRSGSTWLRRMLGQHRDILAGPESGLFTWDGGLAPLIDGYFGRAQKAPPYALRDYLDEATFVKLVRELVDGVYVPHLTRLGKRWVVDKTPAHAHSLPQIMHVLPEARFIYLIRDGRDVVTSIRAAAQSWMPQWPSDVSGAAAIWRDYNEAVLSAGRLMERWRIHPVRYEDLQQHPQATLTTCFDFIGVHPLPPEELEHLVADHSIEQYHAQARDDFDRQFFRKGISGDWRSSLSEEEIATFHAIAGDTFRRLGYASS